MSDAKPTAKAVNVWLAMKNVLGYRSMKLGTSINFCFMITESQPNCKALSHGHAMTRAA
jgi:hypothetical protein